MKKNRQKRNFIIYIVISILYPIWIAYLLYTHSYISLLSVFTAIGGIGFLVSFILWILKREIKYQKIQLLLSITLLLSAIFITQQKQEQVDSYLDIDGYVGIDISKWNGEINLEPTIKEIDFVIIRCGYTSSEDGKTQKIDPLFTKNIEQCIALGIPYGVYFYSLATTQEDAKKEAEFTLQVLDGKKPPLGIYIDLEDEEFQYQLSKKEITDIALMFLKSITTSGNKAGVYANYHWWDIKLDTTAFDDSYLKWLAFYNDEYQLNEEFHIHQYTDTGTLESAPGHFDINIIQEKFW